MAKRQKHVFDTGEIPHLWMHRTQDDARNRQGNLYFTGDTIYSYGSHFPIARHVVTAAGKRAILFTTASYSVTTSGHCSAVRAAIHGVEVFHVPIVKHGTLSDDLTKEDHAKNLAHYVQQIEFQIGCAARGRASYTKEYAIQHAREQREEAIAYAKFFRLRLPKLPTVPALDSAELARIKAREAKRAAEKAEQTKRERAEAMARQAEKIAQWRAGTYHGCFFYDVPAMLRVLGDEVQTSLGARFPVSHTKRALAFVRRVRESGKAYVRDGHSIHLGPYVIDRIEPDGTVKAGCHVVSWEEIERIAPFLDSLSTSTTAIDSTSEVPS